LVQDWLDSLVDSVLLVSGSIYKGLHSGGGKHARQFTKGVIAKAATNSTTKRKSDVPPLSSLNLDKFKKEN
jgi:hypothetical protein